MPDGTTVQSGELFYRNATGAWASLLGTPGATLTAPFSATWLSLRTTTPAEFPSISTVLSQITSDDYTHPDIYVREGKTVERLIAAGTGEYQRANEHTIVGATSYLLDIRNGKRYELPIPPGGGPSMTADSEWVVTRPGISDRFPDVVNSLLTSTSGGSTSDVINHAMIDYQSLVLSNAHVDRLGLKLSGVIDESVSFIDYVTDYACWFDLITTRRRNTFGLLPDSTEETYITAIFTPFNAGDMTKIYESNTDRSFSQIGTFVGDNLTPISVPVAAPIVVGNQHYIDSSFVSQNAVQLKQQLNRIAKTVTGRDVSMVVTAPVGVRTVTAGDFVIGESEYFTDRRTFIGGIIRTPTEYLYSVIVYDSVYTFVNGSPITNNILAIDAKARRDGLSAIRVESGDYVIIVGDDKLPIYAKVEKVNDNSSNTTVILKQLRWVVSGSKWVESADAINLPEDLTIKIYRFGGIPTGMFFYDEDGIPRRATARTYLEPQPGDATSFVYYAKFIEYGGTIATASPIIYERDVTLWRVASVEPMARNLMGKAQQGSRSTQGYRISCTIYDGTPLTYAPSVLPPTVIDDSKLTVPPPTASSVEVEDYIVEIAIGNEFDRTDTVTHKWRPGAITVGTVGARTEDDATVRMVLDELSKITGVSMSLVTTGAFDVTITFQPEADFVNTFPGYPGGNFGFFNATISPVAPLDIIGGIVLIDNTNNITETERKHLILEELTQLLTGCFNDSYRYADSIFQQRWTQVTEFSKIDREAITVFSNPAIVSGMTAAQLRDIIKTL